MKVFRFITYIVCVLRRTAVLAACAAVAVSVSCRRVDEGFTPRPDYSSPILLSANMDGISLTKGGPVLNSESLKTTGFGAMAYWRETGSYFDGIDPFHEYFNNAHFSYTGTVGGHNEWRTDAGSYWPVGCSLTFFFWAPWMDADGDMLVFPVSHDGGGLPRGRFTQDPDPARQIDFCLALPAYDRTGVQGPVPAIFNHALTEVRFYFNITGEPYEGDDYVYRIDRLVVRGVAGTNTFAFGGSDYGFRWDNIPHSGAAYREGVYELSVSDGTLENAVCPFEWDMSSRSGLDRYLWVNGPADGHLYLLPQELNDLSEIRVTVSAYHHSGDTWEYLFSLDEKTIKLPESVSWKPGDVVAYTGSIDISRWIDIELGAVLLPWGYNQEDAGTFDASEL